MTTPGVRASRSVAGDSSEPSPSVSGLPSRFGTGEVTRVLPSSVPIGTAGSSGVGSMFPLWKRGASGAPTVGTGTPVATFGVSTPSVVFTASSGTPTGTESATAGVAAPAAAIQVMSAAMLPRAVIFIGDVPSFQGRGHSAALDERSRGWVSRSSPGKFPHTT